MQRTEISGAILQLKALGIDDVLHFDFLSSPPSESMIYSLELLFSLGALDDNCKLTEMGEKMSGNFTFINTFELDIHIHRCVHTCIHICICTYIHMYIYVLIHTCICICLHITYTYMSIYIFKFLVEMGMYVYTFICLSII